MPAHLKRATRYRAHAVTCLANAEAARDDATRRAHLAVAKHFYSLAEDEISQREAKRPGLNPMLNQPRPKSAPAAALIDAE